MNTMNEEALKRELKAIDQQTETIIAAIFNAARREHITLGRLDSILDMAKTTVHDLMRNTLIPNADNEKPFRKDSHLAEGMPD